MPRKLGVSKGANTNLQKWTRARASEDSAVDFFYKKPVFIGSLQLCGSSPERRAE